MVRIKFKFQNIRLEEIDIDDLKYQVWDEFKNLFELKFGINKTLDIYFVLLDENNKVISSTINDTKKFWIIYHTKYSNHHNCYFEINIRQPVMISSLDTKPSLTSNINISVHKCCQDGNFELLKELVQNGSHINARDEFSSSPLHYAALNGYLNIVKYLIGGKAFKNNKNSSGHTPFLCASMNGHLDVVKYLVEEKVFTFAVDDSGNSALHLAAQNGHNELIKWLLENNIVDPSIKNRCGQTYQDILFPPSSSKSPSDSRIPSALHLTYLPCRIDGLTHSVDVAVSIPNLTWETLCMLVLKACLPNFEMITATESSLVDYAILLEEDGDEGSGKIDDMRKFMKVFTKIYKQNSRMTFLFFLVKEHDRLITVNSAPITQNIPIESSMVNKINEG